MRFFFRSRQFKIILVIFAVVVLLTATFSIIGSRMAPHTDIFSMVSAPIKSAVNAVSDAFSDLIGAYGDGEKLMLENAELKAELNEMRDRVSDYEALKEQNEFYKSYLEIKEANPDFSFIDATLVSRDSDDPYKSFTLNKGSMSGISKYDTVMTDGGLIGYVSEVGLTSCKVTTILNPEIVLGALDSRTNDSGVLTGNLELAQKGLCRFKNLSRSCNVAIGDYVMTSGEGIFPEHILIGSIEYIGSDEYNTSIYAEIKPFVSIDDVKNVMVITSFDGQGGIPVGQEND